MDSFSQPFLEKFNRWIWCLGTETVSASLSKAFGHLDGIGVFHYCLVPIPAQVVEANMRLIMEPSIFNMCLAMT